MLQVLFCNSELGLRVMGFLGTIFSIVKIIVPIILILVGTISLVKCIINNEQDKTKKEIIGLIKKAVLAVTIFLLPSIIMFLFNLVGENFSGTKCVSCLLDQPSNCIKKADNIKKGISDSLCSIYHGDPENCKAPCEYNNGKCNLIGN